MSTLAHLKEATDRLSELLASLDVERTVSIDMLREATRCQAMAALAAVWQARWELLGEDSDSEPDPTDPQAMNSPVTCSSGGKSK